MRPSKILNNQKRLSLNSLHFSFCWMCVISVYYYKHFKDDQKHHNKMRAWNNNKNTHEIHVNIHCTFQIIEWNERREMNWRMNRMNTLRVIEKSERNRMNESGDHVHVLLRCFIYIFLFIFSYFFFHLLILFRFLSFICFFLWWIKANGNRKREWERKKKQIEW